VDKVQFGQLVKQLRTERYVSGYRLAQLVGVTSPMIWQIETGRIPAPLSILQKIEVALNLPHGTLLRQTPQYAMLKDVLEGEPDNG
jgi:transcriptional regulator with XRE-family HTH domain